MANHRKKTARFEWGTSRLLFRYRAGDDLTALGGAHTRAGAATYFDAQGVRQTAASGVLRDGHYIGGRRHTLVEPAGAQWLAHASVFGGSAGPDAAWSKTNVTLTPAAVLGPDGTMSGNRVEATATAAAVIRQLSTGISTTKATFSICGRIGSGATDCNRFVLWNETLSTTLASCTINWTTGVVSGVTGTVVVTDAGIHDGVQWWQLALSAATGITAGNDLAVYPGFDGQVETAGEYAYLTDAQLEPESSATSFIPNATASVPATRVEDVLSFPYTPVPQVLSMYYRGTDVGARQRSLLDAVAQEVWVITNAAAANPKLRVNMLTTGRHQFQWINAAATARTAAINSDAPQPSNGEAFEIRGTLASTGTLTSGLQSASESVETTGADATTQTLPAAWGGTTLYFGRNGTGAGMSPVAVAEFAIVSGTELQPRLRAVGAGGSIFGTQLLLGYPLDEAIAFDRPAEGSMMAFLPSGEADAWDAGTADLLRATVRWVPREDTVTPAATGWDGATGFKAFLRHCRRANTVWLTPDTTDLSAGWTVRLEEPYDAEPALEPDMTRTVRLLLRSTTAIDGY